MFCRNEIFKRSHQTQKPLRYGANDQMISSQRNEKCNVYDPASDVLDNVSINDICIYCTHYSSKKNMQMFVTFLRRKTRALCSQKICYSRGSFQSMFLSEKKESILIKANLSLTNVYLCYCKMRKKRCSLGVRYGFPKKKSLVREILYWRFL